MISYLQQCAWCSVVSVVSVVSAPSTSCPRLGNFTSVKRASTASSLGIGADDSSVKLLALTAEEEECKMPRLCKLRLASGLRSADAGCRSGDRPGTVPLNGQFDVVEPLTRQRFAQHLQTASTYAHVRPPPPPFPAEELEAHGSPHCKLANASHKHPSPI
jgi:hypothetical protein